jgi:2-methylaconitate cis-trans-isomerase PrpF
MCGTDHTETSQQCLQARRRAQEGVKAIMYKIPAAWMRGGTSKCWVFEWDNLQVPGKSVDEVLLRLFGSPDHRQIDGVGGGTSTTSKAVILSRSLSEGADVDYTFAQVAIDEQKVDWGSNCGNCSAVVAPYAIQRGWVVPDGEVTTVRTLNTNTDQLILQKVPTPDGKLQEPGTRRSVPRAVGRHGIPGPRRENHREAVPHRRTGREGDIRWA